MSSTTTAKGLAEFIGTFFLTLTIFIAAIAGSAGDFAPVAIGMMLMVMVYAVGHISGAHFNPAVTIALFIKGDCSKDDAPVYIGVQVVAGVVAGLLGVYILGEPAITAHDFGNDSIMFSSLVAELLFTFALMYVILNVATEQDGNQFYGAAIGFTVMAGAFTVGSISLGSFNPAVTGMLIVTGKMHILACWIHLVPQLIGAVVAVYAHSATMATSEA